MLHLKLTSSLYPLCKPTRPHFPAGVCLMWDLQRIIKASLLLCVAGNEASQHVTQPQRTKPHLKKDSHPVFRYSSEQTHSICPVCCDTLNSPGRIFPSHSNCLKNILSHMSVPRSFSGVVLPSIL